MDPITWIIVIAIAVLVVVGGAFAGRPPSARDAGELNRSRTGNGWKRKGER